MPLERSVQATATMDAPAIDRATTPVDKVRLTLCHRRAGSKWLTLVAPAPYDGVLGRAAPHGDGLAGR